MLKILYSLRSFKQQSISCTPFKAHFGRTQMWHNLVKSPSEQNLNWDRIMLCSDKGRRLMSRDEKDYYDAPDYNVEAELDGSDSSSDELTNATKYFPTRAGSPNNQSLEKSSKTSRSRTYKLDKIISG